jgi:hypothetical protein
MSSTPPGTAPAPGAVSPTPEDHYATAGCIKCGALLPFPEQTWVDWGPHPHPSVALFTNTIGIHSMTTSARCQFSW